MRIRYPTNPRNSSFIKAIENGIQQQRALLLAGDSVSVELEPVDKGYERALTASISKTDVKTFEVDKDFPDPTRFPRRIRVAAYALHKHGLFGQFQLSYRAGVLTMRRC